MVSARMAGTGIRGGRQSAVFVENTNDAENVEVRLQRRRAESETHGARWWHLLQTIYYASGTSK